MAPIRCGGVPTSYSKQLLVVGDAAGHVDPLTGASNVLFFLFLVASLFYCGVCVRVILPSVFFATAMVHGSNVAYVLFVPYYYSIVLLFIGEGIHTAMVAGKIAAQSVSDMFKSHNFSLQAMKAYGESSCLNCFLSNYVCCFIFHCEY